MQIKPCEEQCLLVKVHCHQELKMLSLYVHSAMKFTKKCQHLQHRGKHKSSKQLNANLSPRSSFDTQNNIWFRWSDIIAKIC